jgi:disease resistance protein RPM1
LVDGVCTVAAWEAIRSKFSDNNRRSRIVMTTEMQIVAESCNPATAIYQLNQQSNSGYEWPAIATRSLTISGDNGNLQENVVGDIRRLAQTRMLVPTLDEIEYLYERRYHNLVPADVKECMRYLSIFPKGYGINKKRLIYRWIAEGLVPDVRQGQSLLALAESFLDKLVGKELVELGSISYWYTTCRVPDPMHKVIVSDTIKERYACLVGAMEGSTLYDDDRVRILSIHADDPKADLKLKGKNMRFLRSLSMFQPQDRHKLLDRLAEFTNLKMLDLERCTAVEDRHVRLVCKLILLKFLSFKDTNITVIPDEIGELRKLQTLDVDDTLLTGLPETVTNLVMLERLHFSNKRAWDAVWRLPRGLKKMKALRAIYKAGLTDDVQVAQEIGELAQLQELGIILFNSGAVLQELAQALGKRWPNLQMLHTVDYHGGTKKLNLLLDVPSPPLLLQYTKIAGIIDRLPDWVKLLRQLTEISLSSTELRSDQILGVLCTLPRLLTIGLWRNSYTDAELVARAEYRFPMLKELSVTSDYDEHKVLRFEQGSMPALETLEYRFGNMDKRIVGVEHLTGLKKVTLIGNRGNPALNMTEEQLKSESNKRSARFEIKVAP